MSRSHDTRVIVFDFGILLVTAAIVLLAPPLAGASAWNFAFLLCATGLLSRVSVDQRVGYITLTAIGVIAGALTLSVPQAAVLGLVSALGQLSHQHRGINASSALRPALGASIHSWFASAHLASIWIVALPIILFVTLHNLFATGVIAATGLGVPVQAIFRRTLSWPFIKTFGYFSLAGFLLANVLNGQWDGLLLGCAVVALSVVVGEILGERRVREALETERAEHQRHATTARVVDGLLHNLRNRVALLRYAIEELDTARGSRERTDATDRIRKAVDDAAGAIANVEEGLRTTSGAHPRLADVGELVADVATSYQGMARAKSVRLNTETAKALKAPVDAPMIRDVVSNLIKNAIEASPGHGEVKITVSRGKGRAIITVADDGPGVPDDLKDRLFEPHFTTKSEGTGLGLFTSYGIVREHRGRLVYQPNPKGGAIFTVELPFGKEQLEPQSRPFGASGLQDQSVSV